MLRTISTLTLGLLVLTGCPGDDTGTTVGETSAGTTTAGSTTTESAETNPPGTTTVVDSESADGTTVSADTTDGPVSTTEPGTTTDGTTTEPGTTTDETTTGMGGACEPDAADDECATCVKENCCPALEACNADPDCTCFQECAQKNPGIPGALQCGMDCGVNPLDAGTPTGQLAGCTQMECAVCLG